MKREYTYVVLKTKMLNPTDTERFAFDNKEQATIKAKTLSYQLNLDNYKNGDAGGVGYDYRVETYRISHLINQ